jgi:hypothetical protein
MPGHAGSKPINSSSLSGRYGVFYGPLTVYYWVHALWVEGSLATPHMGPPRTCEKMNNNNHNHTRVLGFGVYRNNTKNNIKNKNKNKNNKNTNKNKKNKNNKNKKNKKNKNSKNNNYYN